MSIVEGTKNCRGLSHEKDHGERRATSLVGWDERWGKSMLGHSKICIKGGEYFIHNIFWRQ